MKALTIWQPYASLLVAQKHKRFETRGWATNYRGPIAIHAAKRPVRQSMDALASSRHPEDWETERVIKGLFPDPDYLDHLPTGAIVGVGLLVRCNAITEGFLQTLTPQERALGDFAIGRYAWEFADMVSLTRPIPAIGKQGLWEYTALDGMFLNSFWLKTRTFKQVIAGRLGISLNEMVCQYDVMTDRITCQQKFSAHGEGGPHHGDGSAVLSH